MARITTALLAVVLLASPTSAQTPPPISPSPAAPPEKIDPVPIQPEAPALQGEAPAPPAAAAADRTASDPLGVPANISIVRLAGAWGTVDGKGFSRVVGVIDGGRQRFYVQWLKEPGGEIFATKELEDEDAAKLRFGDVRAETETTGVTVFFDTLPDADGLRETWVLIVGEPGDVRFGPATN